jgi:hypothetical protein
MFIAFLVAAAVSYALINLIHKLTSTEFSNDGFLLALTWGGVTIFGATLLTLAVSSL